MIKPTRVLKICVLVIKVASGLPISKAPSQFGLDGMQ